MSAGLARMQRAAASLLDARAARGGDAPAAEWGGGGCAAYDAVTVPSIGVEAYIDRWSDFTETGADELLAAVVYVDRLCAPGGVRLTRRNVHRVLLAALLAATKAHADAAPLRMSHYAAVGGVGLRELADLEERFLADVGWRLTVDAATAARYRAALAAPPPGAARPPRRASAASDRSGGSLSSEGATTCSEGAASAATPPPAPPEQRTAQEWAAREQAALERAAPRWLGRLSLARSVRRAARHAAAGGKKAGASP